MPGATRNNVSNEPKVNDFMIKAGQRKIAFLKQYRDISDEVMVQLKQVMHPIDEKREAQRYWDRIRNEARMAAFEAEKNRN